MSEKTTRHKLPYLMPAQAQKHVTHNEALRMLDGLVNIALSGVGLNEPPAAPGDGEIHLVGDQPQDAWSDHSGHLAVFQDGGWYFHTPVPGMTAYDLSQEQLLVHDGIGWSSPTSCDTWPALGINTSPDGSNRLSVKSDAVLFSHDDNTPGNGNSLLTLNRADPNRLAHLQFSTGYGVGAETGLIGDDRYRIRVSSDGTAFQDAIVVAPDSANVGIGATPGNENLLVRRDQIGSTQMVISNHTAESPASAGFRLQAGNGHYLTSLLYGSGVCYYYTNASLVFGTYANKPLVFYTDTQNRMTIHGDGRMTLGNVSPSSQLTVSGAIRPGTYPLADLPSAAVNGAGAMIYVSDATGGGVTAFSDGTNWRRTTDRSIVD